jgi:hypothetical protein
MRIIEKTADKIIFGNPKKEVIKRAEEAKTADASKAGLKEVAEQNKLIIELLQELLKE